MDDASFVLVKENLTNLLLQALALVHLLLLAVNHGGEIVVVVLQLLVVVVTVTPSLFFSSFSFQVHFLDILLSMAASTSISFSSSSTRGISAG